MKVGDKLAELLVKNGVKYVYGVPGGQSLPLYEGIRKLQDQIQHVLMRDERSAGYAADAYARINLAETKRALGKLDEAIALLRGIIAKNDSILEARIYLTEALLEKNELEEASAEVNQVLSRDPQNALARYVRAKVLFQGKLYEDAELSIKQALVLSPENRSFQTFHAQIVLKMNRINEAVEIAGRVVNLEADNWEARLILAQAFLQGGDAATAQEHLSVAAQTVGGPEITLLEARIARKLGDNDRALALYQTYFSQDAASPQIYMEYAELLEAAGDRDAAADTYDQIKERFPDTPFAVAAESKAAAVRNAPTSGGGSGRPDYTPQPSITPGTAEPVPDRIEY